MVYHFFNLPVAANLDEVEAAGVHFCSTPWEEVDRIRGRETQVRIGILNMIYSIITALRAMRAYPSYSSRDRFRRFFAEVGFKSCDAKSFVLANCDSLVEEGVHSSLRHRCYVWFQDE